MSWVRLTAVVAGILFAALGLWAMAAPASFFDSLATFPPYNQHLLQDIGAFQIGLGAVLLLGVLLPADGLATALLGTGVGNLAHTISHVIGADLGGVPARDITFFAFVTVLLLAAGASRVRAGGQTSRNR